MIPVKMSYQERVAEIDAYFDFVGRVDAGTVVLNQAGTVIAAYATTAQSDLLRTLRANAFLLLYNLMESTVTNAIEAIFDELDVQGVSFDDCTENVRTIVLGNLKKLNVGEIRPNLNRLALDVVTKTFRKEEIVSGNVDARKIREIAREYGFDHPEVPQVRDNGIRRGMPADLTPGGLSGNGSDLLTVKTRRNELAHGSATFAEVGRNYSHNDVLRIKCEVIAYLDAVLQNVETYLAQKKYRRL